MVKLILLEASPNAGVFWLVIGIIIIIFIIKANIDATEKRKKAYIEFQDALNGTDKKLALQKGRYYVSLVPKKDKLLEETRIQNDLHGMDDARKID
jgi:hypothetical protein